MEKKFKKIAERVLIVDDSEENREYEIKIQIGHPYWIETGVEAACPVAIEGYLGRLADIRGVDPLNALELTINFLDSMLKGFPETKKIRWPSGESYFD